MVLHAVSGGAYDSEQAHLGRHCMGWTSTAPNFNLELEHGARNLRISGDTLVRGSDDALIVVTPSGDVVCNQDGGGTFGTTPVVDIANAGPGVYHVWVTNEMSMAQGDTNIHVRLDEGGAPTEQAFEQHQALAERRLDVTTTDGIAHNSIGANFRPFEQAVVAGGPGSASHADRDRACTGSVPLQPQFIVELTAPIPLLRMFISLAPGSDADTTLAILGPENRWFCRDDGLRGNVSPDLEIFDAAPGLYRVWVGDFRSFSTSIPATLHVTREARTGVLNPLARPQMAALRLRNGFRTARGNVSAGGDLEIQTSAPEDCRGFAAAEPSTVVEIGEPLQFLRVFVEQGELDTTLAVRRPDGSWLCNDDSYQTHSPTVDVSNAPPGTYRVWVGAYRANERARVRLVVTGTDAEHPRLDSN